MNKKDKREWIIRYAKNNDISDIISEKYQNKKSFKINTGHIEMICSIISIVVIGFFSLMISNKANVIMERQASIEEALVQPIFVADIVDLYTADDDTEMITVEINNNGYSAMQTYCTVISFIDIISNENMMGHIPVRFFSESIDTMPKGSIYFVSDELLDSKNKIKHLGVENGTLFSITLRSPNDKLIQQTRENFKKIPKSFTSLAWTFTYNYVIKIDYQNALKNYVYAYYWIGKDGIVLLSNEEGNFLMSEYENYHSNENGFPIWDSLFDGENLFKYALEKIRALENTKFMDVTYGEYEPN